METNEITRVKDPVKQPVGQSLKLSNPWNFTSHASLSCVSKGKARTSQVSFVKSDTISNKDMRTWLDHKAASIKDEKLPTTTITNTTLPLYSLKPTIPPRPQHLTKIADNSEDSQVKETVHSVDMELKPQSRLLFGDGAITENPNAF